MPPKHFYKVLRVWENFTFTYYIMVYIRSCVLCYCYCFLILFIFNITLFLCQRHAAKRSTDSAAWSTDRAAQTVDRAAQSTSQQGILTGRQCSTINRLLHDLLIAQRYRLIAQIHRWHATLPSRSVVFGLYPGTGNLGLGSIKMVLRTSLQTMLLQWHIKSICRSMSFTWGMVLPPATV